jgi:hypothetical protein
MNQHIYRPLEPLVLDGEGALDVVGDFVQDPGRHPQDVLRGVAEQRLERLEESI